MLYLLLGCLLSLVLQIVNSEFGLQKDNVFVVISFFFVLMYNFPLLVDGVDLSPRPQHQAAKPQPWDPAGQLLTFSSFTLYYDNMCNIKESVKLVG